MVVITPEHRYFEEDGSREYTAVTDCLKNLGIIDDRWFHEEATMRGTRVHRAIAAFMAHEDFDLKDDDAPYFESFLQYYSNHLKEAKIVEAEVIVSDPVYGVAGTIDMKYETDQKYLIDWKTGVPAAWHELQLQIYSVLDRMTNANLRTVYLKPAPMRGGSRYHVEEHSQRSHAAIGVLSVNSWKANHGYIPR